MGLHSKIVGVVLLFLSSSVVADEPETFVHGGYDQYEMDQAIEKARRETEHFVRAFTADAGESFAVKVPIVDGEEVEHFWLTGISYAKGQFTGFISNHPGVVTNVSYGEMITVEKADISDWMYMKKGKMYGNYTLRPLIKTLPKKDADYYRSLLADPDQ